MDITSNSSPVRKLAMLGNHLPRQCGIATFTTHLTEAIAREAQQVDVFVVAMNDPGQHHRYPPRVRFEIPEADLAAYQRAADFLNVSTVDALSVQHEYGIFGGRAGAHLLGLLRELRMPVVTTLHTILAEPSSSQRTAMDEVIALSTRLVVMSEAGAELLRRVHGVYGEKIDVIPHGIPRAPVRPRAKDRLGLEGRKVVLTFGLLSPDKGIEQMIEALPDIAARFPDVVYVVLGATHPHVRQRHGESYRLSLQVLAEDLGVEDHVIFYDRFVDDDELWEFLVAADVYVTPYLKEEQSTSGTLAYALGAGRPVISTPYWYAREVLAAGRGVLVRARDPHALSAASIELLGDEGLRQTLSSRATAYSEAMAWPVVARRYLDTFERASQEHRARRRDVFQARTLARGPVELPEVSLRHVAAMTDDTGMLQHARFTVPRYEDGYCLDDNARALRLMALIEDSGLHDGAEVRTLGARYLAFVAHAFNPELGRFRNFMSYQRCWTEERGSEDSHGRALWALGTVVGRAADPGRHSLAGSLFHAALGAIATFTSPRAWAFTLLGVDEYLRAFRGDSEVEAVRHELSGRLLALHARESSDAWPWFEDRVTYENPRLPQALLASGVTMKNDAMISVGLRALEWLASIQLSTDEYFTPVGSNGFYARGGTPAAFDQQPLEACAFVAGCVEAQRASGDPRWARRGRRAMMWFVGQNQVQVPLYDASTGGCRDGLHERRANENQGAESTLSFLLALLDAREGLRAAVSDVRRRPLAVAR